MQVKLPSLAKCPFAKLRLRLRLQVFQDLIWQLHKSGGGLVNCTIGYLNLKSHDFPYNSEISMHD